MTQLINTKLQENLIKIIILTFPITFTSAFVNFYLIIFTLYFLSNLKKFIGFLIKKFFLHLLLFGLIFF